MRTLLLALGAVLMAAPALAQAISPDEAQAHGGQTVTIKGTVSEVATAARSGVTFIDMGGHYPDNSFAGVIYSGDAGKFPDVGSLSGKTIEITGEVLSYKGHPQIIINDPAQIKIK